MADRFYNPSSVFFYFKDSREYILKNSYDHYERLVSIRFMLALKVFESIRNITYLIVIFVFLMDSWMVFKGSRSLMVAAKTWQCNESIELTREPRLSVFYRVFTFHGEKRSNFDAVFATTIWDDSVD